MTLIQKRRVTAEAQNSPDDQQGFHQASILLVPALHPNLEHSSAPILLVLALHPNLEMISLATCLVSLPPQTDGSDNGLQLLVLLPRGGRLTRWGGAVWWWDVNIYCQPPIFAINYRKS